GVAGAPQRRVAGGVGAAALPARGHPARRGPAAGVPAPSRRAHRLAPARRARGWQRPDGRGSALMVAQPAAGDASGRPALADVVVVPMRRRHLRGVMAIEESVYPRSWSASLFASELEQPETRRYLVALSPAATGRGLRRRRPVVVGYA